MLKHRVLPRRGLSIVELMVGVAVGLFIVGGAVKLFVDNLASNRRMLVETRVNQDLRAAADLIARDLRRAGYWPNATAGMSSPPASNPYRSVDYDVATGELTYRYGKDSVDAVNNATEFFGVRRAVDSDTGNGVLQLRTNGWQSITDPRTIDIPAGGLEIVPTPARITELWEACTCLTDGGCTKNQFLITDPSTGASGVHYATRQRVAIRQYELRLVGRAVADPNGVVRRITEAVRVRNDEMIGGCPN